MTTSDWRGEVGRIRKDMISGGRIIRDGEEWEEGRGGKEEQEAEAKNMKKRRLGEGDAGKRKVWWQQKGERRHRRKEKITI
jgi:hypothetical protein